MGRFSLQMEVVSGVIREMGRGFGVYQLVSG